MSLGHLEVCAIEPLKPSETTVDSHPHIGLTSHRTEPLSPTEPSGPCGDRDLKLVHFEGRLVTCCSLFFRLP